MDQAWAGSRWENCYGSIGILEDEFLDHFNRGQRIRLMGSFAMDLCKGIFSGPYHGTLVESKTRGVISYVSQIFRENDHSNPTKDEDGELGRVSSKQYISYKNIDPNPKQQNGIPICVGTEFFKKKATQPQQATSQFSVGGFFYACISCEYLRVPQAEKRRTDILRLRCLRLFKDGR